MIIKENLLFEGSKGDAHFYTLFDSGATFSCINEELAVKIANIEPMFKPMRLETANAGHFMEIKSRAVLDFYINDVRMSDEFMVIPSLSEDAILGANTFQKWKIKLDFEHDKIIIDPKVAKAILKQLK
jgi:predicted aspartyl protease